MIKNISRLNLRQFVIRCTLGIAVLIGGTALARPVAAQSSDPFSPTPMTTDTVKGRWSAGKLFSHYYSFVAGPGVVKVMFNGVPDSSSMIIAGELTDADGHLFKRTEDGLTQVNEVADGAGARLVSTYDIKRRQQLTVRFYTSITPPEAGGSYSIKVTGDGVAFNQGGAPTSNNTGSDNSGSTNTGSLPCLPKSGRLRIEMEDGSVQEINLSRVREAKIRP